MLFGNRQKKTEKWLFLNMKKKPGFKLGKRSHQISMQELLIKNRQSKTELLIINLLLMNINISKIFKQNGKRLDKRKKEFMKQKTSQEKMRNGQLNSNQIGTSSRLRKE